MENLCALLFHFIRNAILVTVKTVTCLLLARQTQNTLELRSELTLRKAFDISPALKAYRNGWLSILVTPKYQVRQQEFVVQPADGVGGSERLAGQVGRSAGSTAPVSAALLTHSLSAPA